MFVDYTHYAHHLFSLHRYLTDIAHVDFYWFIGSRLHLAPPELPLLQAPLSGASTVPWRYHFNTGKLIIYAREG